MTKREYFGLLLCHAPDADSKFLVDVLDTFTTIRVAVAYVTPDGEKLTSFPADLSLVSDCLGSTMIPGLIRIPAQQMHGGIRRLTRLAKLYERSTCMV